MITGGIKFFEPSKCLFKEGAIATANSNPLNASLILNYDKDTAWVSSGSTEGVAATITITLPSSKTFNRLFLLNHNLKTYTVTYGAGATNFANVITVNNASMANITETTYGYDSSYYEFDAVTTDQINISCTNVQNIAVTVEKFLSSLILTTEIGTFSIDGLAKTNPKINPNNRIAQNFNNKSIVQRGADSFSVNLSSDYVYEQADLDLYASLYERNTDFLVWLCGGRVGSTYFRISTKPFRLLDVYRVQNIDTFDNSYYKGLYSAAPSSSLSLVEVEG
jgi:hypothetical protein